MAWTTDPADLDPDMIAQQLAEATPAEADAAVRQVETVLESLPATTAPADRMLRARLEGFIVGYRAGRSTSTTD